MACRYSAVSFKRVSEQYKLGAAYNETCGLGKSVGYSHQINKVWPCISFTGRVHPQIGKSQSKLNFLSSVEHKNSSVFFSSFIKTNGWKGTVLGAVYIFIPEKVAMFIQVLPFFQITQDLELLWCLPLQSNLMRKHNNLTNCQI